MTAWHTGRTFWKCICAHRDERTTDAPDTIPCWGCERTMTRWCPPGVAGDVQRGRG